MISANPPDQITIYEDATQELTEESHIKNKPSTCQGLTAIKFIHLGLFFSHTFQYTQFFEIIKSLFKKFIQRRIIVKNKGFFC